MVLSKLTGAGGVELVPVVNVEVKAANGLPPVSCSPVVVSIV